MVRRVDSVSTLMSCSTTPITTKFISPYDAIATPAVTTICGAYLLVTQHSAIDKFKFKTPRITQEFRALHATLHQKPPLIAGLFCNTLRRRTC